MKPKTGRPPTRAGMIRGVASGVAMFPEEYGLVKAAAVKAGQPVVKWCRKALVRAAKRKLQ